MRAERRREKKIERKREREDACFYIAISGLYQINITAILFSEHSPRYSSLQSANYENTPLALINLGHSRGSDRGWSETESNG